MGNSEDSLAVEICALPFRHNAEQAEVVFFNGLLAATCLKFAFGTVGIEDEVRRRSVGNQNVNPVSHLCYLVFQGRDLHPQRDVVVPMDDFAEGYLPPKTSDITRPSNASSSLSCLVILLLNTNRIGT